MEKEKNIKKSNTFNMVLDAELKRKFNIKCIANGTTMSKVLKTYIEEYVKEDSDLTDSFIRPPYDLFMD